MVDISDRATEREEELREDALNARRRAQAALAARPSAQSCERCDQPIPPARQRAVPGVQLCVPCQSAAERLHGQAHGRGVR